MKQIGKILLIAIAIGTLATACKKDEGGVYVQGDGKSNPDVQAFQKNMKDEMGSLTDAAGVKGIMSLSQTFAKLPFLEAKRSYKRISILNKAIENKFVSKFYNNKKNREVKTKLFYIYANVMNMIEHKNKSTRSNSLINFDEAHGIYKYNASTKDYDKISDSYDGILIQFPSDVENNPSECDGELYISRLLTQKVTYDGEEMELPTNFSMVLNIKSEKMAGLSFDVVYGNDFIPVSSLRLNIFVMPIDFNLKFNSSSDLLSLTSNLTNIKTSSQLFSANVNLLMANQKPVSTNGYVQISSMKADFQVTIPGENVKISESNFSDYMNIVCSSYPSNNYIGKVKMVGDKFVIATTTGDLKFEDLYSELLDPKTK